MVKEIDPMLKEIDTGNRVDDFEEGDEVRDVFEERNATVLGVRRHSILVEYQSDGLRGTQYPRHLTHRSDG